jgi:hypothetical protein
VTGDDVVRLRTASLEWRAVEGEIVALDLSSFEYLHLNRTGAVLWQLLAGGATRAQLARHLVETYGLPEDDAAADVDSFLASLDAQRLLQA